LETAEGGHVGSGFGGKAEQPPGEQTNPDAVTEEQAAVFELRVVGEKGAEALVEGSEAVCARAGAAGRAPAGGRRAGPPMPRMRSKARQENSLSCGSTCGVMPCARQ